MTAVTVGAMPFVLLRGGSRDGESTTVDDHVTRIHAASEAPGLVDIYEATTDTAHVARNDEDAIVYAFVDQVPLDEGMSLHMPHTAGPGH